MALPLIRIYPWRGGYARSVILVACAFTACNSSTNVVRLIAKTKQNAASITLTTEHYLSFDGDRMLELDRGERSLRVDFKRPAAQKTASGNPITLTLKLYDTDPKPHGTLVLKNSTGSIAFEPSAISSKSFHETVTVLDTGQRQEENPNLSHSAQAQTGYITFGKPVAAGSAERHWIVYTIQIAPESKFFQNLTAERTAVMQVRVGERWAEADASEKQVSAWQRYATGTIDESNE